MKRMHGPGLRGVGAKKGLFGPTILGSAQAALPWVMQQRKWKGVIVAGIVVDVKMEVEQMACCRVYLLIHSGFCWAPGTGGTWMEHSSFQTQKGMESLWLKVFLTLEQMAALQSP